VPASPEYIKDDVVAAAVPAAERNEVRSRTLPMEKELAVALASRKTESRVRELHWNGGFGSQKESMRALL